MTDSCKFNEWMNEEDYDASPAALVADDSSAAAAGTTTPAVRASSRKKVVRVLDEADMETEVAPTRVAS